MKQLKRLSRLYTGIIRCQYEAIECQAILDCIRDGGGFNHHFPELLEHKLHTRLKLIDLHKIEILVIKKIIDK